MAMTAMERVNICIAARAGASLEFTFTDRRSDRPSVICQFVVLDHDRADVGGADALGDGGAA